MSDGEFHGYIALLIFSGLVLSLLAVRGFGQTVGARLLDGLFSLGFLGYAAYLIIADPMEFTVFYYAFAAPVFAVIHVWRSRAATRASAPAPSEAASAVGYGAAFAPPGPADHGYAAHPATPSAGFAQPGLAQPGFAQPGFAQPGFDQVGAAQEAPVPNASPGQFADQYASYHDLPSGLGGSAFPAYPEHSGHPGPAPAPYPPVDPVGYAQPAYDGQGAPAAYPNQDYPPQYPDQVGGRHAAPEEPSSPGQWTTYGH
ncbi:hypothetical protein EV385_0925 [Krasilnikovia cinnamomea]|uniref:Uncharacterized protein n=1 Tax=Krasilnikovia cinnamomea TaxID=349313 RepID=A0A4Q7ZGL7_9ACTN|nr:hypothetical protein [Krasilnikovia cinnamomea]RZU49189.1 hypothetical protein EV385_0925 [Krasilnikovia cinnamomea]